MEPEPDLGLKGAQQLSEQVIHYAGEIGTAVLSGVEKGVGVLREHGITDAASRAYEDVVSWLGKNVKGIKPDYSGQTQSNYSTQSRPQSLDSSTFSSSSRPANRWSSNGYGPSSTSSSIPIPEPPAPTIKLSSASSHVPVRRDVEYERSVIESICVPVGARLAPPDSVLEEFSRKIEHFDGVGAILAELLRKAPSLQHKLRIVYVMDGVWKNGLDVPVSQAIELAKDILVQLSHTPQAQGKVVQILRNWGLAIEAVPQSDQVDLLSIDKADTKSGNSNSIGDLLL